jgi:hypothetical protein
VGVRVKRKWRLGKWETPDEQPAKEDDGPVFFFDGASDDGRDVREPVAYDENGNPLYAPRGRVFRLPWK